MTSSDNILDYAKDTLALENKIKAVLTSLRNGAPHDNNRELTFPELLSILKNYSDELYGFSRAIVWDRLAEQEKPVAPKFDPRIYRVPWNSRKKLKDFFEKNSDNLQSLLDKLIPNQEFDRKFPLYQYDLTSELLENRLLSISFFLKIIIQKGELLSKDSRNHIQEKSNKFYRNLKSIYSEVEIFTSNHLEEILSKYEPDEKFTN